MRRLVIGLASAAVIAGSCLVGAPPSVAAGPGQPAAMTGVEVSSSDLDQHVALANSTLTVALRWTVCSSATGQCNPSIPASYELQVGVATACQAASCTWTRPPELLAGLLDQGLAATSFGRVSTPPLAQLLGGGLAPNTTVGVVARVHNANGWSNWMTGRITVLVPAPTDRVPTNVTAPTVGTTLNGTVQLGQLVASGHALVHSGAWRGAPSPAYHTEAQIVICPDATCAVPEAAWTTPPTAGAPCTLTLDGGYLDFAGSLCTSNTVFTADQVGVRARVRAQSVAGWSAWAYSPVVLAHPAVVIPPICVVCKPIGIAIDLGAFVPAQPAVDPGALVRPSPTRAPAFTMASAVAPIAVQTAVPSGTALGAIGTAWALPAGWTAPDLVPNTAFTLWGCATTDAASCQSVGSWPADGSLVGIPRLTSMGPVGSANPYVRVAQTSDLVNPNGVATSFTTLSDWISLTPAAGPVNDPNANPNGGANGGQADGTVPAVDPGFAQVLPEVIAAGVNQTVSPVAGMNGTGTVAGRTMIVRFPAVVRHNVKYRATARITPKAKGTVRFVVTRRTPSNKVAVGKVRVAKVRKGKAVTSWRFESSKPVATYVIVATFTPKAAGVAGITVTLTTRLT